MFERFTASARGTVIRAREEAVASGDGWVGTDHVAVALAEDTGIAGHVLRDSGVTVDALRAARETGAPGDGPPDLDADALRSIGIDLDAVRRSVEDTFGEGALDDQPADVSRTPGRRRWGHVPFSAEAKGALERSLRQALMLGDSRLGSEHLLLGVLDTGGDGARLLTAVGVDVAVLRTTVVERSRRSA